MTVQTDVMRGIIGAAIEAIGLTLPIKVPGIGFEPPNDQKYFEIVLIQANNTNETWGNDEVYSGILRIILHWPIDKKGVYPPNDVLFAVKEQFHKGRNIFQGVARLLIYDVPRISDVIESPPENLYPLSVRYRYFHKGNT